MRFSSIVTQGSKFAIHDKTGCIADVRIADVVSITVYKIDELTTDLVCCDIEVRSDDVGATWTVHEDMSGFAELMQLFETLPAFRRDWRERVARPAFARNWTELFRRGWQR